MSRRGGPLPADERVIDAIDGLIADLEAAKGLFALVREHESRRPSDRDARLERGDRAALVEFLGSLMRGQHAVDGLRRRLPGLSGTAELPARTPAAPPPLRRCLACGTTRPPFRHGLCDRHRKQWERAGRPAMARFVAESRVPLRLTDPVSEADSTEVDSGGGGDALQAS